jgi:hypothetical protein
MTFELTTPTTARLAHVNMRTEKHGEDDATAIDLKFTMAAANDALAMFHPRLREALYFNRDGEQGQESVEGVPPALPNRLFPSMAPIAWDTELSGATVIVDYGLGGESNITFGDCRVNAFKLAPIEGGSVEITFRVQTSDIPAGALDKLSGLLNRETQVTVTCPAA